MEQTYLFRNTDGRGLLSFPAFNHNHAASKLRKLVKKMDDWKLEKFA